MPSPSHKKGFTLIETLAVLSIFIVIGLLSFEPLVSFYQRIVFKSTTETVRTALEEARKTTLSSLEKSQYGVHIESGRVVIFKGSTFTEPNVDNDEIILHTFVEISTVSLNGGGDDIVFDRLTGETSQGGYAIIRLKSDTSASSTITVYASGLVDVN